MKIVERANSRLGESVSDLYRTKIRLGEFKAVCSMYNQLFRKPIYGKTGRTQGSLSEDPGFEYCCWQTMSRVYFDGKLKKKW